MRLSWTVRRTNQWAREKVGVSEENGVLSLLKRRKVAKYGHWKCRPSSIPNRIIEYELPGPCKIGRPKTTWINNIDSWTVGGLGLDATFVNADGRYWL